MRIINHASGGQGHIYKTKDGKWGIKFYYIDSNGEHKRKSKSGFDTKREMLSWKEEFISKEKHSIDMTFESFYELYKQDNDRNLRETTIITKNHIIEAHILPYFKDKKLSDINALDIKNWQTITKEKNFSQSYLHTINTQLSAMFNYAVRYYNLFDNPCKKVPIMGKTKSGNLDVWNNEQMKCFLSQFEEEPTLYYAFYTLYVTGIRLGEMLALTIKDIHFEEMYIDINKSLARIGKKDIISPPKTPAGIRKVHISKEVVEKLKTYLHMLYGRREDDRVFELSKSHLEKEMKKGAENAGLKPIRIHDIRHSHASFLIANGVDIATISRRLGHEKISTTLNTYSHMFDENGRKAADLFNNTDL